MSSGKKKLMINLLVKEYLDRTEHFDRKVCTGPVIKDSIMPYSGKEMALCSKNAQMFLKK